LQTDGNGVLSYATVAQPSNATTSTAGLMSAADKTKVDGIEASADVTDTANVTSAGALMTTGGTMSGNQTFGDDVYAGFGDSNEFQIKHQSNGQTHLKETGGGSLFLDATNLYLRNEAGESYFRGISDGSATLYHNNNQKLITTSSGVSVTGSNFNTTGNFGRDTNDRIAVETDRIDFYINGNIDARLESDGDWHADGNVIAYSTTISDPRLKENIEPVTDALAKVEQLNGYTFTYKADGVESAGVISTEVKEVLPSAIKQSKLSLKLGDDNETEYDIVQYDQLHALLIEAVKELSARVKELENDAS